MEKTRMGSILALPSSRRFWMKAIEFAVICASLISGFHLGSNLAYLAGDAYRAERMGLEKTLELLEPLLRSGKHEELRMLLDTFQIDSNQPSHELFSAIGHLNSQMEELSKDVEKFDLTIE